MIKYKLLRVLMAWRLSRVLVVGELLWLLLSYTFIFSTYHVSTAVLRVLNSHLEQQIILWWVGGQFITQMFYFASFHNVCEEQDEDNWVGCGIASVLERSPHICILALLQPNSKDDHLWKALCVDDARQRGVLTDSFICSLLKYIIIDYLLGFSQNTNQ